MENDHECHKLDYGWVWHKPTWATYGGAAMRAADPAARSSSPHLAAQYWGAVSLFGEVASDLGCCDHVTNTVEPSIGKPRSSVVHKFIHQDIAIDNGE